jgi:hypothetical protein
VGVSLAIDEEIGNRVGMAKSFALLSVLAEEQGQPRRALEQAIRAVSLFEDIAQLESSALLTQFVRLALQFGNGTLEESWQRVTGNPLPHAVREFIDSTAPSHDAR